MLQKLCALQAARSAPAVQVMHQGAFTMQEAEEHEKTASAEHALQVAEWVEAAADMPERHGAQLAATQRAAATGQTASEISKMVAAVMEPLKEQVRPLPNLYYAFCSLGCMQGCLAGLPLCIHSGSCLTCLLAGCRLASASTLLCSCLQFANRTARLPLLHPLSVVLPAGDGAANLASCQA